MRKALREERSFVWVQRSRIRPAMSRAQAISDERLAVMLRTRSESVRSLIIAAPPESGRNAGAHFKGLKILATDREREFDELVSLAPAICGATISLVSLIAFRCVPGCPRK